MFRNKRGFTLIEIIVGVTVFAIIIPLLLSVWVTTSVTNRFNSTQIRLQLEGRRSLDTMVDLIKQANGVLNDSGSYSTDADTLIITVPGVDSSQTLLAGNDVVVFDFDATGQQTEQDITPVSGSIRATGKKPIANDVTDLTFSYFDKVPTELCTSFEPKPWWMMPAIAYAVAVCDTAIDYTPSAFVKIEMTLSKNVGSKQAKVNLTDEVRLRNK